MLKTRHTKLKVGKELHDFAKTKHLFLNNSITYVMSLVLNAHQPFKSIKSFSKKFQDF